MRIETTKNTIRQLFINHRDRLQYFLLKRLANPDDAQELAQEAYLWLLRISRSEYVRHPEAYLYRIARNLVHELYTGLSSADEVEDRIEILESPGLTSEELADRASRLKAVEKAMTELSYKCQAVVMLTCREGLNQREVGERMGLSRSMVQKYLSTGLAHCRKRLTRFET